MKDYNFEYTDSKFTLRLIGLSFLIFVILIIGMVMTVKIIGVIVSLIFVFGVPLLIFFLNKKKIKKQGTATIYGSYSDFKLTNLTNKVVYSDIKTYQVERYNGTSLIIKFKDGMDLKLQANSNFCNSDPFEIFCQDFEKTIHQYKTTSNTEITRKKSMFERAWMLPLLLILTVGLVGGIIFAISLGKRIPPTFYTSAAIIIPMWIAYYNARKRKEQAG